MKPLVLGRTVREAVVKAAASDDTQTDQMLARIVRAAYRVPLGTVLPDDLSEVEEANCTDAELLALAYDFYFE